MTSICQEMLVAREFLVDWPRSVTSLAGMEAPLDWEPAKETAE